MEFINEPVTVETQLRDDGSLQPLSFVWRGRRLQIRSWGRESDRSREDRSWRCYLIQTSAHETWELCYDKEKAQWLITRHWANQHRIA